MALKPLLVDEAEVPLIIRALKRSLRPVVGDGIDVNDSDSHLSLFVDRGSDEGGSYIPPPRSFPAIITGNSSAGTNRWAYTFKEAEYAPDGTLSAKTGGRTGTAYNRAETAHTATYAWGIDTTHADYPAGHAPRPIGGGGTTDTHKYNVGVSVESARDTSGDAIYFFDLIGSHDGACEE